MEAMRVVDGWLVEITTIPSLMQEQCDDIGRELRVLAVSTRGLFDDPVLCEGQTMRAHYLQDYHAHETVEHIRTYLQLIGLNDQVSVVLQAAQWTLES
jgi:hypothetical protein